jgi:hypothetical protein
MVNPSSDTHADKPATLLYLQCQIRALTIEEASDGAVKTFDRSRIRSNCIEETYHKKLANGHRPNCEGGSLRAGFGPLTVDVDDALSFCVLTPLYMCNRDHCGSGPRKRNVAAVVNVRTLRRANSTGMHPSPFGPLVTGAGTSDG